MILVIAVVVVVAIGVLIAVPNIYMRRRGYSVPGTAIVRCSKGHIFKTTWVEGVSLRAIKLGPRSRYQRCPVGNHWAVEHLLRDEDLTEADRRLLAND
jgi:hypothetical protein